MKTHICYEDNQGLCYNGCGKIMNRETFIAYFGEDEYERRIEILLKEHDLAQETRTKDDQFTRWEAKMDQQTAEDQQAELDARWESPTSPEEV